MKKCFNNMQMFKSSEDCDKYSKSVSYETLVGGTTTTGRERKQTQKMFLSSADKPLSAVGTLTSLLCNSAKVMEKLFYRHSEPKANNPKKTGTVIIGRGCEPIISAESLYCHARPRSGISAESKRDPRLIAMQSPRMTEKALSLSGASSEKQKESSLILRKAKFQAIFKFVLSSASGGAGGGKYNRISAFVSMLVLLIRSSLEKFFKKNFRDDSFSFLASPKDTFYRHPERSEGSIMNNIKYWIFRFVCTPLRMTIPALALIFTLITTAESWADEIIPTSGTCNSADTCLWSLGSDGTLTISAKDGANDVIMANYNCEGSPCDQSTLISRPWEASLQQIKSVVIGDNITHIGNDAFQAATNLTSVTGMKDLKTIQSGVFAYTGLTSITIPDSVTSIGDSAFYNASGLESITIPDSVTSIGNYAFAYTGLTSITIPEGVTSIKNNAFSGATGLKSIIIPDNIDTKNWYADVFNGLPKGTNIVCQGDVEKCKKALAKFGGTGKCTVSYCINSDLIVAADESQCTSTNYYWSGSSCNNKKNGIICAEKWKRNEDFCNRIRYTPAEAAKVLHDNNTNSVTITFKK